MRVISEDMLRKAFDHEKMCGASGALCSIDVQDDYIFITMGEAYKDFTPRTVKGVTKKQVEPTLKWLAKEVFDFIHNGNTESEDEFDEWHYNTCKDFIIEYDKTTKTKGKIKYGKAQKILNMTFKYIYCFMDSSKYSHKFEHCHMPLDNYTLNCWFCNEVVPGIKSKVGVTKIKENSWSNLDYGRSTTMYTYMWYQNEIRNYLSASNSTYRKQVDDETSLVGTGISPFIAEFFIWKEEQIKEWLIQGTKLLGGGFGIYPKYENHAIMKLIKDNEKTLSDLKSKFY